MRYLVIYLIGINVLTFLLYAILLVQVALAYFFLIR